MVFDEDGSRPRGCLLALSTSDFRLSTRMRPVRLYGRILPSRGGHSRRPQRRGCLASSPRLLRSSSPCLLRSSASGGSRTRLVWPRSLPDPIRRESARLSPPRSRGVPPGGWRGTCGGTSRHAQHRARLSRGVSRVTDDALRSGGWAMNETETASTLSPQLLARAYDRFVSARWRGVDEAADPVAVWFEAHWVSEPSPEPEMPPASASPIATASTSLVTPLETEPSAPHSSAARNSPGTS